MVAQLHRSSLGPVSRAYYEEILDALATFSREAALPGGLDHTAAFEVFRLVMHDNPRIIWANSSATTVERGSQGVTRMSFSYLRDEADSPQRRPDPRDGFRPSRGAGARRRHP